MNDWTGVATVYEVDVKGWGADSASGSFSTLEGAQIEQKRHANAGRRSVISEVQRALGMDGWWYERSREVPS
jgi:hypothetical protein